MRRESRKKQVKQTGITVFITMTLWITLIVV